MINKLNGIEKIALLIRTVGYDAVVPAIRNLHLPEEILNQIDLATPETVSKNTGIELLREFNQSVALVVGGKRESILDAIDDIGLGEGPNGRGGRKLNGFKKLAAMEPEAVLPFIVSEQPLHQATIMFQLPEKLSSTIFGMLDIEMQVAISEEADKAEKPAPETLLAINAVLEEQLANRDTDNTGNLERLLAFTDSMDEEYLNEFLSKLSPDIAEKIRANVITFSQIVSQSIDVLSDILSELSTNDIAFAFCQSDEATLEKLKSSLTTTKAQDVIFNIEKTINRDDKKSMLSAQKEVITTAKRLHKNETIELVR